MAAGSSATRSTSRSDISKLPALIYRESIQVATEGRGTYDVTASVAALIERSGVQEGLCVVFLQHTSASLIVCENADPTVRSDLEAWLARAVPDGDRLFRHVAEGPDDMSAHVRTALTQTSIALPVARGRLELGTWQGLYLYEHRLAPHRRRISVTLVSG